MDIFTLIPLVLRLAPLVQSVTRNGLSFSSVLALLDNPDMRTLFQQFGARSFPNATPEQATIAAVVTTFDEDHVKLVQRALNKFGMATPALDIDGDYGPLTRKAVQAYQKSRGLKVDEWAGDKTLAAIMAELVK